MVQALFEVSSRGCRGPRLRWGHAPDDLASQDGTTEAEGVGVSRSTADPESSKKGCVEVLELSWHKTHLKQGAQGAEQSGDGRFWMVPHSGACPLCTEPTQEVIRRGWVWWTQVDKHSPHTDGTRGLRLRGGGLQMVLIGGVCPYLQSRHSKFLSAPFLTSILKLTISLLALGYTAGKCHCGHRVLSFPPFLAGFEALSHSWGHVPGTFLSLPGFVC